MLKSILKQIFRGLRRRYKHTYRRDRQNLSRVLTYYLKAPRLREIFQFYNIFEIMFFVLRFAFKTVFWWPILWPYLIFCYIVRYLYIPWHCLFLDMLLPALEDHFGGEKKAKKAYFYVFVRTIYLTVAWVEKFLVNYFGLRLIWRWWGNLLLERIPDYIGRNSDNIAYGVLHVIESIIWVWKTWSRLWDYVMSWFNPWSYWKTRYYLSAYFRDKVGRRYTYYRLIISLAYHNNDFYIRYYGALYRGGIWLCFFYLKFFFNRSFLVANYNYYRYDNVAKLLIILSYQIEQLWIRLWALSPNTASLLLSIYWNLLRLFSFFLKPFFRFLFNYKFSYNWRWIKLRKKGLELGKGKNAGKWYSWLANRRKP